MTARSRGKKKQKNIRGSVSRSQDGRLQNTQKNTAAPSKPRADHRRFEIDSLQAAAAADRQRGGLRIAHESEHVELFWFSGKDRGGKKKKKHGDF